jgi:hypothetical protein
MNDAGSDSVRPPAAFESPVAIHLRMRPLRTLAAALEASDLVRSHSACGAEMIDDLVGDRRLSEIVRHHHERFDGSGYPDGLSAYDIPLGARVIAVADTFCSIDAALPAMGSLDLLSSAGESLMHHAPRHPNTVRTAPQRPGVAGVAAR